MKVLLIGNYIPDAQQSMQRFVAVVEATLSQEGHEVRVACPPVYLGRWTRSTRLQKWCGYLDKLVIFPSVLKPTVEWAEIVHICDHSNAFYVRYLRNKPHLLTCHDVLAIRSALGDTPGHETRWSGRRLQRMILSGMERAQHIACDSEATLSDLLRVAPSVRNRVSRIYIGLNYPFRPMPKLEAETRINRLDRRLRPGRFVLHVGGNQWYKNRLGVLDIFSQLRLSEEEGDLMLVMAGKEWTEEMRSFVDEHNLGDSIVKATEISNEGLRALYSSARFLLFPSLQEGFGWPILEANACGCPVATSNRAPMTEVAGDAAIYVDPDQPQLAAKIITEALKNRRGLRDASLTNAERFKTSGMINAYLELYRSLLEKHALKKAHGRRSHSELVATLLEK